MSKRFVRVAGASILITVMACYASVDRPLAPDMERSSQVLVDARSVAGGPVSTTAPDGSFVVFEGADGGICTKVTFEGLTDFEPVGTVPGQPELVFSEAWQALVDSDAGGVGPFANEPSPSTGAWQATNGDPTINLGPGVTSATFHYSAAPAGLPLVLRALDADGNELDMAVGTTMGNHWYGADCVGDPTGAWCGWDVLEVTAAAEIAALELRGAWHDTFIVDDVTVCGSGGGGAADLLVDIRPGSDDNPVNLRSRGKLPVAVLSSPEFDAGLVDPATGTLGDAQGVDTPVAQLGTGDPMAGMEDVNGDGLLDLVMQFDIQALVANGDLTSETTELWVQAQELVEAAEDGDDQGTASVATTLMGSDAVRVHGGRGSS